MQQWYVDYKMQMIDGSQIESSCHPAAVYKPMILRSSDIRSSDIRQAQAVQEVIDEAVRFLQEKMAADPEVSLWWITGAGTLDPHENYLF